MNIVLGLLLLLVGIIFFLSQGMKQSFFPQSLIIWTGIGIVLFAIFMGLLGVYLEKKKKDHTSTK